MLINLLIYNEGSLLYFHWRWSSPFLASICHSVSLKMIYGWGARPGTAARLWAAPQSLEDFASFLKTFKHPLERVWGMKWITLCSMNVGVTFMKLTFLLEACLLNFLASMLLCKSLYLMGLHWEPDWAKDVAVHSSDPCKTLNLNKSKKQNDSLFAF